MFHRFAIGDIAATVLSDGTLTLPPPSAIFRDAPPEVLARVTAAAGLPSARTVAPMNCLLLDLGGRRILLDCGMGTSTLYGPEGGRLLESMRNAGLDPSAVDAVLLTHGHSDHCWGAATGSGAPSFPNADLYVGAVEQRFWREDPRASERSRAGFAAATGPMAHRTVTLEDGDEPFPGVVARLTPGHTPGHLSFDVRSGAALACVLGDVVFAEPWSYAFPDVATAFDTDGPAAVRTRRAVLDRLAESGALTVSYHAAWPGLGKIRRADGDYVFDGSRHD